MRCAIAGVLLSILIAGFARPVAASPEFAPYFRDHAVVQRDRPLPVWGRADPLEHISVTFGTQTVGVTAGPDGRWIAFLAPVEAGTGGADLTAAGRTVQVIHDVVAGDVWLCAGGSGMAAAAGRGPLASGPRNPMIRELRESSGATSWRVYASDTAAGFSAVGLAFARTLQSRVGVPVGIVTVAADASPLQAWMSPMALEALHRPLAPVPLWTPASLFTGRVQPLLPCALCGILWYQGEGDWGRAADYAAAFPELITAYRSHFGQPDLPFFWVQLGGFGKKSAPGLQAPLLREAQAGALRIPGTGEVVTIDLGDQRQADPAEIGRRLALLAKARVYGIAVDDSGPVFTGIDIAGSSVHVRFTHAGDGLTAGGRPLQSFQVAGPDRVFHPASASIGADGLVVESPAVRQPVAVRYAWTNAPEANLFNGAGLPAAPFRSDAW